MQFDNFKIGEVSSINPVKCTARVIFDELRLAHHAA